MFKPQTLLIFCGAAWLAAAIPVSARNSTDLSAYAGKYSGKASVSGEDVGRTLKGTSTVQFQTAATGMAGDIRVKASVDVDGTEVEVDNRYQLLKSGRVKIDEVAPGVSEDFASKGTYRARAKVIRMKATFTNGAGNTGTIKVLVRIRPTGSRQRIEITHEIGFPGSPGLYVYDYDGKR